MVQWKDTIPLIGVEVRCFGGIGTVCDYSIQERKDGEFERCLWIKIRGNFVKAIGSEVSEVTDEARKAMKAEFEEKLISAGKKVVRQKKERRARTVKGSHLVDEMIEKASSEYTVDKKSSFYKITGQVKGRAVYVLIKGGRVDLSGFTVDNSAVDPITEEQAKARHLGRVRGQMNFTQADSVVMESFEIILKELHDKGD